MVFNGTWDAICPFKCSFFLVASVSVSVWVGVDVEGGGGHKRLRIASRRPIKCFFFNPYIIFPSFSKVSTLSVSLMVNTDYTSHSYRRLICVISQLNSQINHLILILIFL